jgi:suppressor of ftsI
MRKNPIPREFLTALTAFTVLSAGIAGCNISGASIAASGSNQSATLLTPPEVSSSGGAVSLVLTAAINPQTGGPGLEYNGAFIPPTIRVWPGDTININYVNALPSSSTEPLDTTNLHFHGLTVSPNPPSDDSIDILAMPGQTLHYAVQIPASLPPGLYWYHSHAHGEANWQTYNGMSGAIVVNGIASVASETASLPERIIILRNVLSQPNFSELSAYRRILARRRAADSTATPAPAICGQPFGIPGEYTTINGQNIGTSILMQPGQKQLWRVLNASADGFYDLHIDGQNLHLVSVDGVPIVIYPGAQESDVSDYVLPPAGRVDFTVTGPASGGVAFHTSCIDTGPDGDPNPPQVLGLVQAGTPTLPTVPTPGPTARAHGTYDEALGAPAQQRTVVFTENNNTNQFYLNGQLYSPTTQPMFTAQSGTIEQWTLENQTLEVHAFHIHQVHFIVQDINGAAQAPAWTDTVTLPYQNADGTPSVTHVLIDFRDPTIRGTFLFHCHLLEHEDGGMMAKITVQ